MATIQINVTIPNGMADGKPKSIVKSIYVDKGLNTLFNQKKDGRSRHNYILYVLARKVNTNIYDKNLYSKLEKDYLSTEFQSWNKYFNHVLYMAVKS